MQHRVRNLGREGLAATAISAVDAALYDLKARLLDLPLAKLLGSYRSSVPIYGSGGFTSYSDDELENQLAGWVSRRRLRLRQDEDRLAPGGRSRAVSNGRSARSATPSSSSMPMAPMPSSRRCASLRRFAEQKIAWFEEPVSSDDLEGLAAIRKRIPRGN